MTATAPNWADIFEPILKEWFPGMVRRIDDKFGMDSPPNEIVNQDRVEVMTCGTTVAAIVEEKTSIGTSATKFSTYRTFNDGGHSCIGFTCDLSDPTELGGELEKVKNTIKKAIRWQRKEVAKRVVLKTLIWVALLIGFGYAFAHWKML